MSQATPLLKKDPLIDEIRRIRADLDAKYPDWEEYAKHANETAARLRESVAVPNATSSQNTPA